MDKSLDLAASRSLPLTRRYFIFAGLTAAGGFAIGLGPTPPLAAHAAAVGASPWDENEINPDDIDAWIAIEPDDSVLIRYARSEMGQGSMTALPMIVAEELQCDWSKVRIQYASANRNFREKYVYGDMSSVGSHSVTGSRVNLQQVGASARARLVKAAAAKWNVSPDSCTAASSVITHTASGRSLRFGEVASDAAKITLLTEPEIKTPRQYTLIGKPMPRIDVIHKIDGSAKFAIDISIPDMVYAAISACPVSGGKLASVDETPLADVPGIIKVVKLPNAVAVVSTQSFWRAKRALAKLHPEWDFGPAGDTDSALFAQAYRQALDRPGAVARNDGNADLALTQAAKTIETLYETPYLAHAPMEPMNATVHLQPDRLDVWVGTQAADRSLKFAAAASGLKPEQIYIHNTFVGGGFGRKAINDEMIQAIHVAKTVNLPIKLIWTREEDMRHDRYRPQAAARLQAGLDADGIPTALKIHTAVGSIMRSLGINKVENGVEEMAVQGLSNNPYGIANTRVECSLQNTHIPVCFWRSVGASQNAFFIESFVDEIAAARNHDPYRLRRHLLKDQPQWLTVLDEAAEKGNWGKPLPQGSGRGIAIHQCDGTIVGAVAEITVNSNGELKVNRVTLAVDSGHMVNPLTVAEQMEGATIFGLTAALYGKVSIANGAPVQGNFDSYQMVRFAQAPKIDVHLIPNRGKKWGGIAEAGVPPIAPAICNAIFSITGKRLRSLPIMDHNLGAVVAESATL